MTGDATTLAHHPVRILDCKHDDVSAWMQIHPANPGPLAVGATVESVPTLTVAVHTLSRRYVGARPMAVCKNDQESRATALFDQSVLEVEECCVRIERRHRAS